MFRLLPSILLAAHDLEDLSEINVPVTGSNATQVSGHLPLVYKALEEMSRQSYVLDF